MFSFGIVLLEVIARKKAGEKDFVRRQAAKLFALGKGFMSTINIYFNFQQKVVSVLTHAIDVVPDAANTRSKLPSDAPGSMVELAIQCCDNEPSNRPDAECAFSWIEDLVNSTPQDGPDPPLPTTPEFPQPSAVSIDDYDDDYDIIPIRRGMQ